VVGEGGAAPVAGDQQPAALLELEAQKPAPPRESGELAGQRRQALCRRGQVFTERTELSGGRHDYAGTAQSRAADGAARPSATNRV
jgi:hypothetical protein